MSSAPPTECLGFACGYGAFNGEIGCHVDDGSCWTAMMADAEVTAFHDQELYDAATEIQRVLDGVSKPADGRKLSFVHTEEGTLLAWVRHGVAFPPSAVKFKDGHSKVKKALKIKGPKKP